MIMPTDVIRMKYAMATGKTAGAIILQRIFPFLRPEVFAASTYGIFFSEVTCGRIALEQVAHRITTSPLIITGLLGRNSEPMTISNAIDGKLRTTSVASDIGARAFS